MEKIIERAAKMHGTNKKSAGRCGAEKTAMPWPRLHTLRLAFAVPVGADPTPADFLEDPDNHVLIEVLGSACRSAPTASLVEL
jgi:hypothetical protein